MSDEVNLISDEESPVLPVKIQEPEVSPPSIDLEFSSSSDPFVSYYDDLGLDDSAPILAPAEILDDSDSDFEELSRSAKGKKGKGKTSKKGPQKKKRNRGSDSDSPQPVAEKKRSKKEDAKTKPSRNEVFDVDSYLEEVCSSYDTSPSQSVDPKFAKTLEALQNLTKKQQESVIDPDQFLREEEEKIRKKREQAEAAERMEREKKEREAAEAARQKEAVSRAASSPGGGGNGNAEDRPKIQIRVRYGQKDEEVLKFKSFSDDSVVRILQGCVLGLKKKLQKDYRPDSLKLFFDGQQLQPSQTLDGIGVEQDDLIELRLPS